MDVSFSDETERDEALEAVRRDTVDGLREWFEPIDGDGESSWMHRSDLVQEGPLTNGHVTAVAWRYEVRARPEVWGVAADRGPVAIDGVTFVVLDGEDATCSRYIDWHGAFGQMGVAAAGHVVSAPETTVSVS